MKRVAQSTTLLALILALFAGTALAATLSGTDGNDTLAGTDAGEALRGLAGDDWVYGGGGKDILRGEEGVDVLYGDAGRDELRGGPGDDAIHADDGQKDRVSCDGGADTVVVDPKDRVGSGCESVNGAEEFGGGVLATFEVGDERFRAWVTNPFGIEQLRRMESGERAGGILGGRLVRGAGQGEHNAPYSWHFDPQTVSVADVAVPECQLAPSYAEEHLEELLAGPGRFCPPVELVGLRDYTNDGP